MTKEKGKPLRMITTIPVGRGGRRQYCFVFLSLRYCMYLTHTFWNNLRIFSLFHCTFVLLSNYQWRTNAVLQSWHYRIYLFYMVYIWGHSVSLITSLLKFFFKTFTSSQKYSHNRILIRKLTSFHVLGIRYVSGLICWGEWGVVVVVVDFRNLWKLEIKV